MLLPFGLWAPGWTEAGHHAYGTDEEYLRRLDEWWSKVGGRTRWVSGIFSQYEDAIFGGGG